MSLVGTRPPTVDEWEQYELHHRSRMHIEKSSFFVSAWTFFLDSGRPWKKIINKPEIFVIHMLRDIMPCGQTELQEFTRYILRAAIW